MDRPISAGSVALDDILAHYGVKGMKWGVRRSRQQLESSREAATAKSTKKKIKSQGLDSLTNDELKTYLERMDLEKRYKKANPDFKDEAGKFIKDTLVQVGKQETAKFLSKEIAKALAGR